jgi:hypothetical protein
MSKQLPKVVAEDQVDESLDTYLRASAIVEAINANLPQDAHPLTPIPASYVFKRRDREVVSTAMHTAFELIGGVPAFVVWAQKNPKDFYNMWSKLMPSEQTTPVAQTQIVFNSQIPSNALDRVSLDATGQVITIDDLPE